MFHGLSAFPITPCCAQGQVDTDNLAALLTNIEAAKVSSIGLLGSTGSYAYLSRSERLRAITTAAATIANTPLIVGIGALATHDVMALTQDAQTAGANGLLLAPVSYAPLTQDEVFIHYETIAKATDLPICIYNNPGTTHFNFDLTLLQRLADIPNIKAIKMPLPASADIADDLAQLRAALPADFAIGYSADWGCGPAMLAGADAFYSGIAGVLPQVMQNLVGAAQSGDMASVNAQQARLDPLWSQVKVHGGLRTSYTIARHLGMTTALPPKPVQLPPREAEALIIAALSGLDLS
jgi:4-hydroxy-tetrahydrodipicolinate synthase